VAIWHHDKRVLGIYSLRMHRNAYLRASSQKSDPPFAPATSISYKTNVHYRVTFMGYIRCFCATTSHDFVILTFDLLTLRVFRVQCFSCPTHIPILIILPLSVTELRLTYWIWSHFRYLKQSLRMHSITWPVHRGSLKTTRYNFLTPNCLFSIQLLWGYDED